MCVCVCESADVICCLELSQLVPLGANQNCPTRTRRCPHVQNLGFMQASDVCHCNGSGHGHHGHHDISAQNMTHDIQEHCSDLAQMHALPHQQLLPGEADAGALQVMRQPLTVEVVCLGALHWPSVCSAHSPCRKQPILAVAVMQR